MSTFTTSDTQKQLNAPVEDITQQFLSTTNDYFQSEIKCKFFYLCKKKRDTNSYMDYLHSF
jgi:hypothetical protein